MTILRDTVATSWSADDICLLILNISCWSDILVLYVFSSTLPVLACYTCYCRYLLLMLLFSHPVTPFVVSFLCFAKLLSPHCFWAAAHLPLPNVAVSCDFLLSGRQISSLNRIAIIIVLHIFQFQRNIWIIYDTFLSFCTAENKRSPVFIIYQNDLYIIID